MRILTSKEARLVDEFTMNNLGISGESLMEMAGHAVADEIASLLQSKIGDKILIVSGKGNNGGDGFAASLKLVKKFPRITIVSTCKKSDYSGDAKTFMIKCLHKGIQIKFECDPDSITLNEFDIIIDGLLGTGISGEVRENIANWIEKINGANVPTLSIDVPSGINSDNGDICGTAVKADATVTIGFLKRGLLFNDGSLFSGDVTVADIGYPGDAFEPVETNVQLFDESLCYQYLKAPQRDTYKHKQGKVLIIAGAKGFTGAGCLASMGALRSGAGLVVAAVPESLNDIYESKLTEVMTCPLPDRGSGNFHEDCVNDLVPRLGWCDVVAVGPGVGTDDDSKKFLGKLFQLCEKPFVIDADAFSVFQNNPKLFGQFKNEFILTPHFGEASRLMNVDKSNIKAEPINFLHESVQKTGGVWVLKGSPTIVADNLGITINNSGNQGLATSGTGDVLTGLIAGFLAQGIPAEVASKLGVFIHGKAADKLLESHGFKGLIASDLLNIIPGIIRIYEFN
tara:strand:+ start:3506 stop:5041 length:1536 start_codon:yes stop_codon:yes gene_type:complete